MTEKKEIQKTITPDESAKVSADEFLSVLKIMAPGTNFRTAIDGALNTGKGALVVIDSDYLQNILDGGFRINCKFTPQKLIELTKMDGAIILSKDLKRIALANVLLTPDSKIKSAETGTRHKAAERTAKQAKTICVAISERRKEITLFYRNIRYLLQSTGEVLRKANEHVQLIEKQRELFDHYVERLTKSEIQSHSNATLAVTAIQKGLLIQKISEELKKYNIELGKEGDLLKIRLKEIRGGVEKETDQVIKDYTELDLKKSKMLLETLAYEEILVDENIFSALGYEARSRTTPIHGWRILSKTSLAEPEIAQIIKQTNGINSVFALREKEIADILIDEEKAKKFREELDKIKLGIR